MSEPKHPASAGRGQRPPTSTDSVHAGIERARAHHTLTPSIAQTATYTFENTATLERYMRGEDPDPEREEYGRYGNPTVRELERRVAALEGAEDAVAFSSGMAATSTALFALLKAGDHVVLFRDCYRRTRQLITQTLQRFGVEHTVVNAGDLAAMEAALRPNTRLVVTESPTNPLNFCVDLEKLSAAVKAKGRVRTLVDSTFATPINSTPLALGIDLVLHSATKYLSGHNDVLGGVVAGPSHLISLLRDTRGIVGSVLDPHAAFLIMRGMKTLALRVERHNQTALALAKALEQHPKVESVHYPLLESHPSYPIASTQMRGGGGVVSFVVRGGRAAASRVVDATRLPQIAASLGGVESLIDQPAIMSFFELTDEQLDQIGINPALIRLSVGIEETSDLVADLLAALDLA
ncbi:MAG TPA: aminotransferase class I/II-fold pyridoxal phosphate-dependent enzyme [Polyangiaceae bacterium]|nr:aminotransferase class I/II-fold pyridoxal phosphate-dependent enzyme [Polyangiaceae bacterium]